MSVFGQDAAASKAHSHTDRSSVRRVSYQRPIAEVSCHQAARKLDKTISLEAVLAPGASSSEAVRQLLSCYRDQWRSLFSHLQSPSPDASAAVNDFEFNSQNLKWAFHLNTEAYTREVKKFQKEYSELLPVQTSENLILWNQKFPPNDEVISQYQGRHLYNIFQFNFELPSEVIRLRAFLEEEFEKFGPSGLAKENPNAKLPDFTKLIRAMVAVGRFSPKAYREFRYLSQDSTHGGCGPMCGTLRSTLEALGLEVVMIDTTGLGVGAHVILGIQFGGRTYLLDPTVAQYSRLNLPLITTLGPVLSTADAEHKYFDHAGMDGYLSQFAGRAYRDGVKKIPEVRARDSRPITDLVKREKLDRYFSDLFASFDAETKAERFPSWQPIIERNRGVVLGEHLLRKNLSLSEAMASAQKRGDPDRFGAIFELGHRFIRDRGAREAVEIALNDPDPSIRFVSALALKSSLNEATKNQLRAKAKEETDPDVREALIYALGETSYEDLEGLDGLLTILRGQDRATSATAASQLRALGTKAEAAIPLLVADFRKKDTIFFLGGWDVFAKLGRKAIPAAAEASLSESESWKQKYWLNSLDLMAKELNSTSAKSTVNDLRRRIYGE